MNNDTTGRDFPNDDYCGCCGGDADKPPKDEHDQCCRDLHDNPAE